MLLASSALPAGGVVFLAAVVDIMRLLLALSLVLDAARRRNARRHCRQIALVMVAQSFELKPCKSCVPSKMLSISLCIIFHTAQNIGAAMETGHDGELFVKYVQITEGIYRGKKILSRESIWFLKTQRSHWAKYEHERCQETGAKTVFWNINFCPSLQ